MDKIKMIARVDKLTIPLAFKMTDGWLKALLGLFLLCSIFGLFFPRNAKAGQGGRGK
jgi:hypothetical protein